MSDLATQMAPQPSSKPSLPIKDVNFDTRLTHVTDSVWFRRLRLAAETLSSDQALFDDNASVIVEKGLVAPFFTRSMLECTPSEEKRQAKFILAANLPEDDSYMLDVVRPPSAKELYDILTAEYAGTMYVHTSCLSLFSCWGRR
jgi:hypothetical protein